jgi:hypothetical protein
MNTTPHLVIIESVVYKTIWVHKSRFRKDKKEHTNENTTYFALHLFFSKNNWQGANGKCLIFFIQLFFTYIFCIQNCKLKIFLDSSFFTSTHIILKERCMTHVVMCRFYCWGDLFKSLCVSDVALWSKSIAHPSGKITSTELMWPPLWSSG